MGCGIHKSKATSKLKKGDEAETSLQDLNSNIRMPSIYIKSPMTNKNSGFFGWDDHYEYNVKGTAYKIIICRVKYNDCSLQSD